MATKKLTGADYLLLLLYLNNKQPILGAVRLTKMMFIFEKEIVPILKSKGNVIEKLPEFIPYNFGPFSRDVYEQIELFQGIKFINILNINANEDMSEVDDYEESLYINEMHNDGYSLNTDGKYYKYTLLTTGEKYVCSEILPWVSEEHQALLSTFKEKITSLSPKQILRYVYTKYPDYAEKSLIKDEVLKNE